MWWPLRLSSRSLPAVRIIIEINGVVMYTVTDVDSCSSRHFARSRSRQSSSLKLLVCHSFAHLLGNALQLLRQELLVLTYLAPPASHCVLEHLLHRTASDSKSPSSKTLCTHRCNGLVLPTSHHALTPWRYVLPVADVGQLDDNIGINLVVPHHRTVHFVQLLVLSFLARLTSSRSTSHGPLTLSPAFTFFASARTFTFFLNLCCSGSLCQTVPVAFDRSHCLQLAMFFLIDPACGWHCSFLTTSQSPSVSL